MSDKEQGKVYFNPKCFIIGIVKGNFIEFIWNGKMEESFFGIKEIKDEWICIGDL